MKNKQRQQEELQSLIAIGWVVLVVALGLIVGGTLGGCRSESRVVFEGEAKVRTIVDINFEVCDSLPPEDKIECVKTLLEILQAGTKTGTDKTNNGLIGGL